MINVDISDGRLEDIKNFEKTLITIMGYGTNSFLNNPLESYMARIERCKGIESCLYVLKKADRFQFLNDLHKYKKLDDKECAEIVYKIWTRQERFHNCGMSKTKLIKFMKLANKDPQMQEKINALDDVITIYRGTKENSHRGLSWTLSKDTAIWFAKRPIYGSGSNGYVFTGTINKTDVLALFDCRSEKEIVCDYRKVKNIQCEEIVLEK